MQLDIRWPSDEPLPPPHPYSSFSPAMSRLAALQITWNTTEKRRQLTAFAVPLHATPTYIHIGCSKHSNSHPFTHTLIHTLIFALTFAHAHAKQPNAARRMRVRNAVAMR